MCVKSKPGPGLLWPGIKTPSSSLSHSGQAHVRSNDQPLCLTHTHTQSPGWWAAKHDMSYPQRGTFQIWALKLTTREQNKKIYRLSWLSPGFYIWKYHFYSWRHTRTYLILPELFFTGHKREDPYTCACDPITVRVVRLQRDMLSYWFSAPNCEVYILIVKYEEDELWICWSEISVPKQ